MALLTIVDAVRLTGVSRAQLYRYLKAGDSRKFVTTHLHQYFGHFLSERGEYTRPRTG